MRTILTAVAVVAVVGGITLPMHADDVPYGADGLPYLTRRSTLVVEVEDARTLDPTRTFVVYEVKARRALKGTVDAAASIVALSPRVAGVKEAKDLVGGLLFLDGPLDEAARKARGVDRKGPVYDVVAGTKGAIPSSDKGALGTAREYLALKEPDARLTWAVERISNADPYVQRSALLELAEPTRKPADDTVVARLAESLRSENVRADNKGVMVQLLERTKSPRATAALADLAKTKTAPPVLRQEAVRALGSVPGGDTVLRELREGKDPMVAPAAQRALELIRPEAQARPPDAASKYRAQLASPDARARQEGAAALGSMDFSAELVADLRQSALNPKETSQSVRLAAVASLARFSKKESAEALKAVASDESLSSSVRAAAVMGIAKLETGVSLQALKELAGSLRDPEIKKLAAGLADQQ
jgi:hypothetical protein